MLVLRPRLVSQRYCGRLAPISRYTRTALCLPRPRLGSTAFSTHRPLRQESQDEPKKVGKLTETLRENIYTVPNLLTVSRIIACPVLGYAIVHDNFVVATSLLVYAGLTDLVCLSLALCSLRKTVF